MHPSRHFLNTVLALLLAAAPAAAQQAAPAQPQAAPADKPKSVAELVQGFVRVDGYYTLYYQKEKLYAQIGKDKLKKPFLLAISISRGPFAGWQWDDVMVYWELHGDKQDKLLLVAPDPRYRAASGEPLEASVQRTYTESILRAVAIRAQDDRGYLVDFGDLFHQDLAGLGGFLGSADGSLARWAKAKSFPQNVELAVDMVYSRRGGAGRRIQLHYSLRMLPEKSDYQPRAADDRVGYFITAIKDYAKKHEDPSNFTRLVQRWRLEKIDSSLAMSPPKRAIVFYVEKTVPFRFRRCVHEGIAEWNKALEKVGFIGAIEVRQQTDTEFADLDPEDARYNFFRWGTSGMAFAMGPSRVDPRTGEILDADIFLDDAFVRFLSGDYQTYSPVGLGGRTDPKLAAFWREHPEWNPLARHLPEATRRASPESDELGAALLARAASRGRPLCMASHEKARQLALAGVHLAEKGRDLPPEFLGQALKELVMHEVGHTLGLRHNFKGSTYRGIAEVAGKTPPPDTTGSVMDYNAVNYLQNPGSTPAYQASTLGPWDHWAIEYGYRPLAANEEKTALAKHAARSAEKGLAYATDEDTSLLDPDPLSNRWDMGSDPVEYARKRLELVEKLLPKLVDRMVKPGESYSLARRSFDLLLFEYAEAGLLAARFVGGQYAHRDHRGDPNERPAFVLVEAEKQKAALSFLEKSIFGRDAFRFDPRLVNQLGPGRWDHFGSDDYDLWLEYPLHRRVLSIQAFVLFVLTNPFTLSRIHDNELKAPAGTEVFTVADLFTRLEQIVWAELDEKDPAKRWTNASPLLSSMRRNLQREHLHHLVGLALGGLRGRVPDDARTLAFRTLRSVAERSDALLKATSGRLDVASEAHLAETRTRAQTALAAFFQRR